MIDNGIRLCGSLSIELDFCVLIGLSVYSMYYMKMYAHKCTAFVSVCVFLRKLNYYRQYFCLDS